MISCGDLCFSNRARETAGEKTGSCGECTDTWGDLYTNSSLHSSLPPSSFDLESPSFIPGNKRKVLGIFPLRFEYAIPPSVRPSVTKIRIAISWKLNELSEIRWCQNNQNFFKSRKNINNNKNPKKLAFSGIYLTNYPIIAPLRGSHA